VMLGSDSEDRPSAAPLTGRPGAESVNCLTLGGEKMEHDVAKLKAT
jgi:hypothetical protein